MPDGICNALSWAANVGGWWLGLNYGFALLWTALFAGRPGPEG